MSEWKLDVQEYGEWVDEFTDELRMPASMRPHHGVMGRLRYLGNETRKETGIHRHYAPERMPSESLCRN